MALLLHGKAECIRIYSRLLTNCCHQKYSNLKKKLNDENAEFYNLINILIYTSQQ